MVLRKAELSVELDFTGERIVEGKTPPWIVGHHLERYKLAARYCRSKTVLDVGCGTGYGSRILIADGGAKHVVGTDASDEAVGYAQDRYRADGLEFRVADVLALPDLYDGRFQGFFDVVVAFEFIEHVLSPRATISAISKLLCPTGILIISTPNRVLNSPWVPVWEEPLNHFHVREFARGEFEALVKRHFSVVERYGQCVFPGRYISSLFSDYIHHNLERYFSTDDGCHAKPLHFYQEAHTMILVGKLRPSDTSSRWIRRKLRNAVFRVLLNGGHGT
jgi:SAM-dependent methyltransferase